MKQIAFALCMLAFSGLSEASHFRGLSVVDDQIAWMSGSQGTVLRTTDGGTHWDTLNPPGYGTRDFRDIHAWNQKDAVVMSAGDSAVLLKTHNGGKTWIMLASDNTAGVFWDAIDVSGGLILAGDGKVPDIRFSNNLKTMERFKAAYYREQKLLWELEALTGSVPASMYAASGTAIQWIDETTFAYIPVYGDKSLFVKAVIIKRKKFIDYAIREKRSQTITGYSVLPFKSQKAGGAYSFAISGSFGVAVGGSYLEPNAIDSVACYTSDSGKTWLPCDNMPSGYRSCVCKKNNSTIWFCTGTSGTDISVDNGHNWRPVDIPGFNVCAVSDNFIWFAGNKGQWKRYRFDEVGVKR